MGIDVTIILEYTIKCYTNYIENNMQHFGIYSLYNIVVIVLVLLHSKKSSLKG